MEGRNETKGGIPLLPLMLGTRVEKTPGKAATLEEPNSFRNVLTHTNRQEDTNKTG
jgi:hypothetical protein